MNKILTTFKNYFSQIKNTFIRLYRKSYGMDDLNKYLFYAIIILSFIDLFTSNKIFRYLSSLLTVILILRFFSPNKNARLQENRNIRKLIKYLSAKWQYRKTHKVFRCKNCGQLIKIPVKQGKVEVSCPKCGNVQTQRT